MVFTTAKALMAGLVAAVALAPAALALPNAHQPSVSARQLAPGIDSPAEPTVAKAPKVTWPQRGSATVSVPPGQTKAQPVTPSGADSSVVRVKAAGAGALARADLGAGAEAPSKVRIEVLDRKQIKPFGGIGMGLTVARADGGTTTGPVQVSLDYSGFAQAYGGGFASRLHLVRLPACALTTPGAQGCADGTVVQGQSNDTTGRTITATVQAAPQVEQISGMAALSDATVYALTTGSSSDAGDYRASPINPAGKWNVGLGSGAFTYEVPIEVPAPPMGEAPQLALSYNSQAIDGRTSASNNQASWAGMGWDMGAGYIERKYKNCIDDGHGPDQGQQWGDLCWDSPNSAGDPSGAVYNITLNGVTSQLVKDNSGEGAWHLEDDPGWKVQHLHGSPNNPDSTDEFWVITTQDGTRYYFGWGRSERSLAATHSVLTVPVIGDDAGEPCYDGGQPTFCTQAWRWNLDRVVTPNEVENSYFYDKDTNYYRSVAASDKARIYDSASYLTRIEYGWSSQIAGAQLPARINLTHVNRCVERTKEADPLDNPPASCPTFDASPSSYPDVPLDLMCDGSADDNACAGKTYYPTFFSRDVLWDITVEVRDNDSAAWDLVRQYQMKYALMDPSGAVGDQLWLDYIQQRGYSGTNVDVPTINFNGEWQDNKVGTGELNFRRVNKVFTETGSTIAVTYGHARDADGDIDRTCPETYPSSQYDSGYECFWQKWTPEGETTARSGWFKKFVVRQVDVDPGDAGDGDPMMTTTYNYDGRPGWRFTADPLAKDEDETWSDWRGYGKVEVTTGANENKHSTYTWLYRGLDGDRTVKTDATKTSSVNVTDSEGKTWTDSAWLSGKTLETSTRDDAGTSQERTWHEYWTHNTAQYTGLPDARFVRESATDTFSKISTSTSDLATWREHRIETEYDDAEAASTTFGLPMRIDDQGEPGVSDNKCTEIGRAYNTDNMPNDTTGTKRWMVYQDDERHYNVSCTQQAADQAAGQDTLHLDRRTTTFYDGATSFTENDAALGDGNPTEIHAYTDASTYRTTKAGFDDAGRIVSSTDSKTKVTTTSYTPATSWPVNGVKVTTPDPDGTGSGLPLTTTTYFSRFWGEPWRTVDPNGNTTSVEYDGVGRLAKVFKPTEAANYPDGHPSMSFDYYVHTAASATGVPDIAQGDVNRVTSKTLQTGTTDVTSVMYLDGLGRTREIQTPAQSGSGRTVTVTRYDSSGNVAGTSSLFYNSGAVTDGPVNPAVSSLRSYSDLVADWAGRTTLSQLQVNGVVQAAQKTVTTYTGADVTTVKPPVGQSTDTYTDVYGQTAKVVERNALQAFTTTYEYTRKGELKYIHDAKGNTTHYTYNFPGQRLTSEDPDAGTTTTTYDANGNAETVTDVGNNSTLTTTYDALNRPTQVSQGSTVLAKTTYDTATGGKGLPATQTAYSGSNAYTTAIAGYDTRGRATSRTLTTPADGSGLQGTYTTAYHYDLADHVTSVDYPKVGALPAETVTSTYDNYGLLRKVASPLATYLNQSSYDDYGRLTGRQLGTSATGSTVTRTFGYDDARGTDWLSNITTKITNGTTTTTAQDDSYIRDNNGDVTALRENTVSQQQCFTYDEMHRLTGAWTTSATSCTTTPQSDFAGPDPYQTSYSYDGLGNIQSVTDQASATASAVTRDYHYPGYSADESSYTADTPRPHAVTSVAAASGTDSYGYDGAGQMTSRTVGGVASTMIWSPLHRLTSVKTGTSTTSYVYDAGGNVLLRNTPGEKVLYLDGQELSYASGTLKGTRYYSADGAGLAMRTEDGSANGKLTWLLSDGQASTQLAITAVGGIVTRRRYTPFGKQRGTTGLPAGTDRGFVGQPEDASTGLSLLGARAYDPGLGRFLSPDALLRPYAPQAINAYSYAWNNPIGLSDPSGLDPAGWHNTCAGDLSFCDKKTQEDVGYNPKTGTVNPDIGCAIGDCSIRGKAVKPKVKGAVYNWLKKDLGYLGTPYMRSFEREGWYSGADAVQKNAIKRFLGCRQLGESPTTCMKEAKGVLKRSQDEAQKKEEEANKGFWGKVWDHTKEHIGDVAGIVITVACTAGFAFVSGGVGVLAATGCGAAGAAIGGAINYAMSDDKKTLGGYAEATIVPAVVSAATAGTAGTATSLTARAGLSGAALRMWMSMRP
ncbi:RHS repeat-associated core domain-containing protein [Streptomyces sp. NPDC005318]|uniref:RHS repeat domain-containing protein n=1 Tax=Streptomyces sp. NPDC005318 TaxID=3157031 RepID=UPI0033A35E40